MLKQLRRKFVILNMAIVALVLTVAFSTICALTYHQDLKSVNGLMSETLARAASAKVLAYNDVNLLSPNLPNPLDDETPDGGSALSPTDELRPPEIGGGGTTRAQLTPIVTYAVDARGVIVSLTAFSSALIPDEYLSQAVSAALSANEQFGSIDSLGLLFGKRVEENIAYLSFADASSVEGWRSLAVILGIVGAAVLAGFFVISVFFARWALRPVEAAWDQQKQFMADASHELKTPLTVILANAAILRGHGQESVASQSQWIESTQTEAKRMQELVNDMLELARLDGSAESTAAAALEEVDFSDLTEGEVLQFESVAFERGVSLSTVIEPNLRLFGKPEQLKRVVRTLIDNACKYAEEEGSVSVRLSRIGSTAHLSITNSGAVIDPSDLPHIFDRFYRADKSRTRDTGGFGLGLAIAREIARAHNGDITVASTESTGTTFTVTLPLQKSEQARA